MAAVGVPRFIGISRAIALLGEVGGHGGTAIGISVGGGGGGGVRGSCWISLRIRVTRLCLDVSPTVHVPRPR